nr:MAG TPA: hypothetical protein [Caudoviricetes sp.]
MGGVHYSSRTIQRLCVIDKYQLKSNHCHSIMPNHVQTSSHGRTAHTIHHEPHSAFVRGTAISSQTERATVVTHKVVISLSNHLGNFKLISL